MPKSAPEMTDRLLLVEGVDDEYVFVHLLQHHKLSDVCVVKKSGGDEPLRDDFRVRLKAQNETRLGVVIDADLDLEARWRSLRDLLIDAGYASVPLIPNAAGTVVRQTGKKTVVGIWVMPNNVLPGALEAFLQFLVPADDPLWEHAEASVATLPQPETGAAEWRKTANWRNKARLHTYLAWQEKPGTPFGQAITARYLTADADAVAPLMAWVQQLFTDSP